MMRVATIGMFDGVHRGHQFVLEQVTAVARAGGMQSMVVTFDHSVRPEPVLTPLAEKVRLLKAVGVDCVEVLPFTESLKQMSAYDFMRHVLRERFGVRTLLIGYDNRFGRNRAEGFADYVSYGMEMGMEVRSLPPAPLSQGCCTVSSSLIRQQLQEGRVSDAGKNLGRHYCIAGRVEHGQRIGTVLGFPTANIVPDDVRQLIPASGVYAVLVRLGGSDTVFHGMMNIGCRPTFHGQQATIEVNIFHLNADLYGRHLLVAFVERLRGEQYFDSPAALIRQLERDAVHAERVIIERNEE